MTDYFEEYSTEIFEYFAGTSLFNVLAYKHNALQLSRQNAVTLKVLKLKACFARARKLHEQVLKILLHFKILPILMSVTD